MKKGLKILMALASITFLVSCGCSKEVLPPIEVKEKVITVTEVIHDTIYQVPADTSSFIGEIKVDSTGEISLVELKSTEGKSSVKKPKVKMIDNYVYVDCETEAQELFKQWKVQYKSEHSTEIKEVPVPVPPSKLDQFLKWVGVIALVISTLVGIGYALFAINKKRNG